MRFIDWVLVFSVVPLLLAGLVTITGDNYFFYRQIIWISIGVFVFFLFSFIDWRFVRNSGFLFFLFLVSVLVLSFLLIFGNEVRGSTGWFKLPFFSIDPADPVKLLLIFILAKYFSRRHVDIARFNHIFISGFYAAVPAALIFFQPDFGSAIVFVLIWLGLVSASGINKKHLALVFSVMVLIFLISWMLLLKPYQKARIATFLNPGIDPQGAGYNALQATIAVGSGQFMGKGVGYGTQSRLEFLPEHQTDFIFAAFAEEWGFLGVLIVFLAFGVLIWRILKNAYWGDSNFERFFGIGLAIFFMAHFFLHVGMNVGLLPITGLNLTFMSYGGSHMITVFAGLGILMGMRRHCRNRQPQESSVEF